MLSKIAVFVALLAFVASTSAQFTCYVGVDSQLTTQAVQSSDYVCTRYGFTCAQGDESCTAAEITAGTNKTMFTMITQANCDQISTAPETYFDVLCCDTDLCNAPEPRAMTLICYVGVDSELMTYNVTDALYVCARYGFTCSEGDNACTAAEIAAGTNKTGFLTTTQQTCTELATVPSNFDVTCCDTDLCNAPLVRSTPLICYIGVDSEVITYNVTETSVICARYGYPCRVGDSSCTAAEIAAGTNKTAFLAITQQTCTQLSSDPAAFDVLCCSTDLCNAPVATPNVVPTGSAPQVGPVASTPKASFGSVVVPSAALLVSVIAVLF